MKHMAPEMRDALLAAPNADAVQEVLFPDFARFALATYADEITAYRCTCLQSLPGRSRICSQLRLMSTLDDAHNCPRGHPPQLGSSTA